MKRAPPEKIDPDIESCDENGTEDDHHSWNLYIHDPFDVPDNE